MPLKGQRIRKLMTNVLGENWENRIAISKMPAKRNFWTRILELKLVEFIRQREFIWRPVGNTNHQIQQKYKAYAEFAAMLNRGFTARSVRDRWVNIRSTYNNYLRRVERSKLTAESSQDVYTPCWPLWKPLQFLRDGSRNDELVDFHLHGYSGVKQEITEFNEAESIQLRQSSYRTDRPRRATKFHHPTKLKKNDKCQRVLDDLITAMKPLTQANPSNENQSYWFFGKHVTERLNSMSELDSVNAGQEIVKLLEDYSLQCTDGMT